MNTDSSNKKFARAYVVQNSQHNFSELKEICEEIVFISSGYDGEENLLPLVVGGLQSFSPRRDVLVPVGNVFINLLVGMVVAELVAGLEFNTISIAIYREKAYHIQEVEITSLGDLINAYRVP
jgi:hypothetical protein